MKITNLRVTTVTVPLEAPLRHASGAHWGRFVRTILELETDEGITGLGEMGGGGESAELAFEGLRGHIIGENPFNLEGLRFKICNPTASLYNNRTQIYAAIEFACLDIIGKKMGVPVYDLLGGKVRDEVEFASYLFFRYPNEKTGKGEIKNSKQLVEAATKLRNENGFRTHKLKGGVFHPDYELECYLALGEAFPNDRFRFDPNATLSLTQSIEFANAIRHMRNDYLEDFTWGIDGMKKLRDLTSMQTGTNTVVVNFEQLAQNIHREAVDVILLDTTFCKLEYADGKIKVPDKPGLGVELDRDKLGQYAELYFELGGYPYDKDPQRPDWYALVPNDRWAPAL